MKVLGLSRWKGSEQTLVVFMAEGAPAPMGWKGGEASLKRLMVAVRHEGFTGKVAQVALVHPEDEDPARRVLLAGVGPLQGLGDEAYRRGAAVACKAAAAAHLKGVTILFPEKGDAGKVRRCAQAIVEGAILGSYRFTAHKTTSDGTPGPLEHAVLLHPEDAGAKEINAGAALGEAAANAAVLARDLVNEPPSHLTPQKLAERASKLGGRVRAKVFDLKTLERMGMGGVAGVGRGSVNPPVFIYLKYQGSKPKTRIALVGKGVTFDSGGLSLKPAESMETMKCDMAGAATVMAVMKAADALKLPIQIDGYIPAVENMPSGSAIKPGDVLKLASGKTVEVLNTDAEGRLIIADALAHAVKEKPDHVIDIATLTGGAVTALGTGVTAIMGTDQALVTALIAAGEAAGEPMWQLPLVKDYEEMLKSRVADLRNTATRKEASTIMGGLFLKDAVGGASWAHLDIAGTAWSDREGAYTQAGATGCPVRALLGYLVKVAG
ncbi:MAG: leucyl aminopeptidase [Candidatus Coatesbacteria bacterium]